MVSSLRRYSGGRQHPHGDPLANGQVDTRSLHRNTNDQPIGYTIGCRLQKRRKPRHRTGKAAACGRGVNVQTPDFQMQSQHACMPSRTNGAEGQLVL
jgi:hypothetical protein